MLVFCGRVDLAFQFHTSQEAVVAGVMDHSFIIIADTVGKRYHPDPAFTVYKKLDYFIIGQAIGGGKIAEAGAVEATYTGFGSKPQKTFPVLCGIVHMIAHEAVFDVVMPVRKVLTCSLKKAKDDQKDYA